MYEPGSPSSPFTTTNFGPAFHATRQLPLEPGREAGTAAAAQVGGLHLLQEALGRELRERASQAREVALSEQHRLVEDAHRLRRLCLPGRPREHALERARAGVDDVAVAERRARVAEAEAHGLAERARAVGRALADPQSEGRLDLGDVRSEVGRPAPRRRADADVPHAARLQEVVVERRDAVDGRLRKARELGRTTHVLGSHFAVVRHRLLQHVERGPGNRRARVSRDELDQVVRGQRVMLPVGVSGTRTSRPRRPSARLR